MPECARARAAFEEHRTYQSADLADCAENYVAELRGLSGGDEDCLDAVLDDYECYAATDCDLDVDEALERADTCAESSAVERRCMLDRA